MNVKLNVVIGIPFWFVTVKDRFQCRKEISNDEVWHSSNPGLPERPQIGQDWP